MRVSRENIAVLGQKSTVLAYPQSAASRKGCKNGNWCSSSAVRFSTPEKIRITECTYVVTKLFPLAYYCVNNIKYNLAFNCYAS